MAIKIPPPRSAEVTYEMYLTEGTVEGRYDIVDGARIPMPGATWEHQEIVGNIFVVFRDYQKGKNRGRALMAPFDVLIRRMPRLQTRQPDVLFISLARLAQGGIPQKGFLAVAPELVVEVISDSETKQRVEDKLKDYVEIGVSECWRVWPETRTVEVLRLNAGGYEVAATYGENETVQSLTFLDLKVSVAAIFAS